MKPNKQVLIQTDDNRDPSLFTPELGFFINNFFKYELNNFEKLIFYSYFVTGMTLQDLAEPTHCTFQNIAIILERIEKKLRKRYSGNKYKYRKRLEEKYDSK